MAGPTHAHAHEYETFCVRPSQLDPLATEEWVIRHGGGIKYRILCYGDGGAADVAELREMMRQKARPPLRIIPPDL